MPVGLMWEASAGSAIAAELLRRFPHKAPSIHAERGAALRIKSDIEAAWRSYNAGASAALFDVLSFLDTLGVPVPEPVAHARDELLVAALEGRLAATRQGAPSPLDLHRRALRKRLRWHAVSRILEGAEYQQQMDDPEMGAVAMGADPDLYQTDRATWPEVSDSLTPAAELARRELGENMVGPRSYYDDFKEIQTAAKSAAWPGLYYLPSQETCERLGMGYGLRILTEVYAASDAPCWGVP